MLKIGLIKKTIKITKWQNYFFLRILEKKEPLLKKSNKATKQQSNKEIEEIEEIYTKDEIKNMSKKLDLLLEKNRDRLKKDRKLRNSLRNFQM